MPHILLYFLAIFSLSTAPIWAKLNQMPPEVLGFYRLTIASTLLSIWIFIFKKGKFPKSSKDYGWAIFSGFLFFLHLWTYKFAAKNTLVSNTMILFSLNPVWLSVGAVLFFKERFHWRLLIAYLLSFVSIYLLVAEKIDFTNTYHLGNLSAVVSAFLYAAYMLSGKKARAQFSNSTFAFIQYFTCALCFGVSAVFTGANFSGHGTNSWMAIAGLIVLPTFLGHFLLTYLLPHLNMTFIGCGKLLEPIISSIIAYFVFAEVLSPIAPVSFGLCIAAVLILILSKRFLS